LQTPLMHEPMQHVPLLPPHDWPMFLEQPFGGAAVAHAEKPISGIDVQVAGLQHAAPPSVHRVPIERQAEPLHRSTPKSSALQGAYPQHSLCMLQMPSFGMQQAGLNGS